MKATIQDYYSKKKLKTIQRTKFTNIFNKSLYFVRTNLSPDRDIIIILLTELIK